jgi:hypothetical protein
MMGYLLGWVCIGLGAALGACIWPFRRGILGFCLNTMSAVLGAIGAASLGVTLGLSAGDPRGLPLAGVGAIALLAIVHLSWNRPRLHRRRPHRSAVVRRV